MFRIDAIVGLDVLARTNFSIDYQTRMLNFAPEGREDAVAPLEIVWPFVTVRMTIAGQQVRLLVDTGSSDLVLFKTRMPAALSGAPWRGDKTVQYASGAARLQRLELRQAGLGAHVWDKLPAWALDRVPHGYPPSIDGVARGAGPRLPARAIRLREGRVRVEPVNRATRKSRRVRGVESRRAFRTLSKALQNGFRIGELHHVEPSLNSVTGPAGTTRLEPKVMQVLVCLAAQAGQVVPKERLMRTVWPDTFVGDDVLTRSISELRRVFGDDVKEPRFIQTIPKSGYRLIAGVSSNAEQDLAAPDKTPPRSRYPPSRKPHATSSCSYSSALCC